MKSVVMVGNDDPIDCLRLCLREISVNGYRGMTSDVTFVKFFVLNATALRVLRIGVPSVHGNHWWSTQRRRLQLHKKGSPEADVRFQQLIWLDRFGPEGVKPVIHDLSVSDPFLASF